jgi:hypothetical protein
MSDKNDLRKRVEEALENGATNFKLQCLVEETWHCSHDRATLIMLLEQWLLNQPVEEKCPACDEERENCPTCLGTGEIPKIHTRRDAPEMDVEDKTPERCPPCIYDKGHCEHPMNIKHGQFTWPLSDCARAKASDDDPELLWCGTCEYYDGYIVRPCNHPGRMNYESKKPEAVSCSNRDGLCQYHSKRKR